jgi:hypothetical protein
MKRGGSIVIGYEPFVSSSRVESLERGVSQLDAEIKASKAPRLDAKWRASWRAFVRRWQLERDSYASWGDRLSPVEGGKRLDAFGENYQWWAADFEARSGQAVARVAPVATEGLVPNQLWLILGAAAVVFAFAKGKG